MCHPISHAAKITSVWLIFVVLSTATAAAGHYTISWTGLIEPSGALDPWGLGAAPQEFVIEVDVPLSALDYSSLDVPHASFDLTTSRLWIGNQSAVFVGPAGITFTDGGVGAGGVLIPDLIFFGGEFSLNGNTAGFASALGIDRASFTFTQLVEPPPIFAATFVVTAPGMVGGTSIYSTSVPLDTLVTVVPEPAGIWLSLALLPAVALHPRQDKR